MRKFIVKTIKATILNIIVALFIVIVFFAIVKSIYGAKIDETVSLLNKVSVKKVENVEAKKTTLNEKNKIKNYPSYGSKYANIEIPKIDVNLPVYFGDTLEILKKGVGHDSSSYFPGEGKSIIYMGHNSKKVFRRFGELQKGNEIKVKTSYGEYTYKIYDMQLIEETEMDKMPIQEEKEILMVYTCYPFHNIGYTTKRYVVYAELVK